MAEETFGDDRGDADSDALDPDLVERSRDLFTAVAENSAIGLSLVSREGRFRWVNPAMCQLMHRSRQELLALSWHDITHPSDLTSDRSAGARVLTGEADSFRVVKRFLRGDGAELWGDVSVAAVRDPDGSVQVLVSQVLDVTDAVMTRAALAESQERYRLLAENASDVVSRTDADGVLLWISPSVTELIGWRPEDLIGKRTAELSHPDDLADALALAEGLKTGAYFVNRGRVRCADDSYRWISATVRSVCDETGAYAGRVAGWRDATAEVAALDALAASEEHFRLLAENASDVIIKTDSRQRIEWISPSVLGVLGWRADDVLGRPFSDLAHPDDHPPTELDGQVPAPAQRARTELRMRRADGTWLWMNDVQHVLTGPADGAGITIHALRDIHVQREAREALQFLAFHDPLTRLATRAVAEERLSELLDPAPGDGKQIAVLFIDIDGLKAVNDELGHAAGDSAISEVARRLLVNARADDVVARFGGDEYVAILPSINGEHDAIAVAERMRRDAAEPIRIDGREIRVSVSIGVALALPGANPLEVVRRADDALYTAKRAGRDRTVVGSADD